MRGNYAQRIIPQGSLRIDPKLDHSPVHGHRLLLFLERIYLLLVIVLDLFDLQEPCLETGFVQPNPRSTGEPMASYFSLYRAASLCADRKYGQEHGTSVIHRFAVRKAGGRREHYR